MSTSQVTFPILIRNFNVILLLLICSFNTVAHDDLLRRISKVTEEIEAHSDSASLYLKGGKLNYQHDEFKNSFPHSIKDSKTMKEFYSELELKDQLLKKKI